MKQKSVIEHGRALERRWLRKTEAERRRTGKRVPVSFTKKFHESARPFGRTAREAFASFQHEYTHGPALAQSALSAFKESYKRSTRRN